MRMLTDDDLDALADRLAPRMAALLADIPQTSTASATVPAETLVDAKTVAAALQLDLKTVYRRREELGGRHVGRSVRFDLAKALAGPSAEDVSRSRSERPQPTSTPATPRRRRSRKAPSTARHCQLLPVGRAEDRETIER